MKEEEKRRSGTELISEAFSLLNDGLQQPQAPTTDAETRKALFQKKRQTRTENIRKILESQTPSPESSVSVTAVSSSSPSPSTSASPSSSEEEIGNTVRDVSPSGLAAPSTPTPSAAVVGSPPSSHVSSDPTSLPAATSPSGHKNPVEEQTTFERKKLDCSGCLKKIEAKDSQWAEGNGKFYHLDCFCCSSCGEKIRDQFQILKNGIVCDTCFQKATENRCTHCSKVIEGNFTLLGENYYHAACVRCHSCAGVLGSSFFYKNHLPHCGDCVA